MKSRKILSLILSFLVVFSVITPVSAEIFYEEKTEKNLTDGVIYKHLNLYTSTGWQNVDILEADLNNPYISASVMTSEKGLGYAENVLNLAKSKNSIGAVNGDFFSRSSWEKASSMGLVVKDGEVVSTSSKDVNGATIGFENSGAVLLDYITTDVILTLANGESVTIKDINKYDSLAEPVIYTKEFAQSTDGSFNNILEVVVTDGVVTDIRREQEGIEIPENGYVIRHLPEFDPFLSENIAVGDKVTLSVNTSLDVSNLETAMGGGTLLLKNGQKHEITHNVVGSNPRTMAGTDKSGTKLYLVTVEGRVSGSNGMTLSEMQDLALRLGMDTAINLDGGGSTTMVMRDNKANNLEVVNRLSDGSLRTVPNGLEISTSAPKGKPEKVVLKVYDTSLFKGTSRKIEIDYVLDEYGNPCENPSGTPVFTASGGTMNGNIFKAQMQGKAEISVTWGSAKGEIQFEVLDAPETLTTVPSAVYDGGEFEVFGVDKNGNKALISNDELNIKNFAKHKTITFGKAQGVLYITENNANTFEASVGTAFAYPENVAGAKYTQTTDKAMSGKQSGKLEFSFSNGEETQGAYLEFSNPINVTAGMNYLGVWVYAPCENYQALKIEGENEQGETVRATLTDSMEFSGFRYLTCKIPDSMKTIKRIYVVQNTKKGAVSSYILLDNLELLGQDIKLPYLEQSVKMPEGIKGTTISVSAEKLPRNTLLSRIYDASLTKGIENLNANLKLDLNSPQKFELSDINGMVFAVNEKGITGADKTQWSEFLSLVKSDKKTLIIGVPCDLNELPNNQGEIIREELENASKTKQVILLVAGSVNKTEKVNGITKVSVSGLKFNNAYMFKDQMKYMCYANITVAENDMSVKFERVYND